MNLKKAVGITVLVYLSTFILGSFIAFAMGMNITSMTDVPPEFWFVSFALTVILVGIGSFWYFKDKKVTPSAKEGALLGVVMVVISFALDFALIIPVILTTEMPIDMISYYTNPMFWTAIVLLFATTTVVGWHKGKKK